MLEDGTIDIGEALAITEDACLRVRADAGVKHSYHIRDVVPEVLREFEEIRAHSGLIGKTTGITKLDAMTTGIRPDEYWIVGARPSRGKTVLGVQIATANAMQNVPTLFFSFEMTRRQIVRRMLPFFSDIEAWKIRDPRNASVTDMRYIHETSQRLTEMPLWVVDPDGMKASDVLAAAHFHIHRYGIKLIVVDYLQIIRGPQRDIRERVTHCSNMLRSIPKMHGVSLVATSQLRRLEDENSRPSMSDLKESGDIEAHAHTVLLIHRPIKDRRWTGEDELVVAKQREGLVGTAKVWLSDAKLWFVERET
jgi:replicative DNA helicase